MDRLKGKQCIVTGAGDGIGRGIALAFAKEGASVAVCDINQEQLQETHRILEQVGGTVFSKVADVRSDAEIKRFVDEAGAAMGGINVFINNAAIMPVTRLETLTEDLVDSVLSVNLRAPILFAVHVLPWMIKAKGGSIIYMSSATGHNGFPDVSVYGACKGGLIALARGHAMELAEHHIRVNTVSPGAVDSPMLRRFVDENAGDKEAALQAFHDMHPRGIVGSIEEIAAVFVFLASDEAANITAEDIRCDGGLCKQGTQPK